MPDTSPARPHRAYLGMLAAMLLVFAGGALGVWWSFHRAAPPPPGNEDAALARTLADAGIDARKRAAIEDLVRAYILDHPEILPEAVQRLQDKQAIAAIEPMRGALETPFPGAVLGNPDGKLVMVEFTDFACTYCRASVGDVEKLISANPDLKVVIRELPIISPASEPAARMGLAAAEQGRYAAFHKAMFTGPQPSPTTIDAAARAVGLNLASAKVFGRSKEATQELQKNMAFAQRLRIDGTPAFVIGDQLVRGAVGRKQLQAAIDAARKG